jgi:hypothetical protein
MLPETARVEDFVEVTSQDCEWFGFIGTIDKFDGNKVAVKIFDKVIMFERGDLKIKARKGSKTYQELADSVEERAASNLTAEDYNDLINLAIDMQDYAWATELVNRKNSFKKVK